MTDTPEKPDPPPLVVKFAKPRDKYAKQKRWRAKNYEKYLANQREYLKKWRAARGKG